MDVIVAQGEIKLLEHMAISGAGLLCRDVYMVIKFWEEMIKNGRSQI